LTIGCALPLAQLAAAQSPDAADPSPSLAPPKFSAVEPVSLPRDSELGADAALDVADELPAGILDLGDIATRADALVTMMPASEWSIDELAVELDYDPMAAFAFVRDSIAFDPYPGQLRGPLGTLAARAGNDVDRALLLQALLDAMLVRTRLVTAQLDAQTTNALLTRAFEPPARPLSQAPLDQTEIGSLDSIARRARRDFARLRTVLGDRLDGADGSANGVVPEELRTHVWIQMDRGHEWLDLDPTRIDSEPGQTLAAGAAVIDAIPDDWRHMVSISVVAEILSAETLDERQVLEHQVNASTDAGRDIYLTLQPEITSLGGSIIEVIGSVVNWQPVLYVDSDPVVGSAFPAQPSRDIIDSTESGPEVSAVYLDVTVTGPSEPPRNVRRVLFDRVPPEVRSSTTLDRSQLLPLAAPESVPLVLQAVHQIQISNGAFRSREHALWRGYAARFASLSYSDPEEAASYGMPAALVPLAISNESLVLGSERLIDLALDSEADVRAYVAKPRVFVTSIAPGPVAETMTMDVDLLIDSLRIVTRGSLTPVDAAVRQMWYGAVATAVETEHGLRRTQAMDTDGSRRAGVSFAMSQNLQVIDSADLPALQDVIDPSLAEDLRAGLMAVVPGSLERARVWWAVDPLSGSTRAVLSPGLGGIHHYVNAKPNTGPRYSLPGDPDGPPMTKEQWKRFLAEIERDWDRQQMRKPPPRGGICGSRNSYLTTLCPVFIALGAITILGITIYLLI
jgi:hypothetical protein